LLLVLAMVSGAQALDAVSTTPTTIIQQLWGSTADGICAAIGAPRCLHVGALRAVLGSVLACAIVMLVRYFLRCFGLCSSADLGRMTWPVSPRRRPRGLCPAWPRGRWAIRRLRGGLLSAARRVRRRRCRCPRGGCRRGVRSTYSQLPRLLLRCWRRPKGIMKSDCCGLIHRTDFCGLIHRMDCCGLIHRIFQSCLQFCFGLLQSCLQSCFGPPCGFIAVVVGPKARPPPPRRLFSWRS
jgi:hypothetical protein